MRFTQVEIVAARVIGHHDNMIAKFTSVCELVLVSDVRVVRREDNRMRHIARLVIIE